MTLTPDVLDRAAGVLLGQASGDALGVPYEFEPRITLGTARMVGGGLGPYAPGEWSDDTQMAVVIAQVAATGADLRTPDALDAIAEGFLDWQARGASDIGQPDPGRPRCRPTRPWPGGRADDHRGRSAVVRGQGRQRCPDAHRPGRPCRPGRRRRDGRRRPPGGGLTHPDVRCLDSCVLWSEAVRVAVTEGVLDVRAGITLLPGERREEWLGLIERAETDPPATFTPNGYTVAAFRAAWSAIHSTRHLEGPAHVESALQQAIAIGNDTDTVAAIAGALLGARYGLSGCRRNWRARCTAGPGWTGATSCDWRWRRHHGARSPTGPWGSSSPAPVHSSSSATFRSTWNAGSSYGCTLRNTSRMVCRTCPGSRPPHLPAVGAVGLSLFLWRSGIFRPATGRAEPGAQQHRAAGSSGCAPTHSPAYSVRTAPATRPGSR